MPSNITPAVLRPTEAARYIGMSLPSFWRFAKNDPTFPRPFRLGEKSAAVMRADLDDWLASRRRAAQ